MGRVISAYPLISIDIPNYKRIRQLYTDVNFVTIFIVELFLSENLNFLGHSFP
jgi:hypothetical protein